MKITKRQLRRIIREEKAKLLKESFSPMRSLVEQNRTLDHYLDGSYSGYKHGDPESAARRVKEALRMAADAIAQELPNVGDALEPGFRGMILQTLVTMLEERGVRVRR